MQKDDFSIPRYRSLDEFRARSSAPALRVCIATEEILGPVRNGGIASTYYHLARGLAARGHHVEVMYLKGRHVENETPEHWIEHYASFGITLHYLDFDPTRIAGAAPSWQARYLAFHDWLASVEPFQVVHTSEWRGGAYYALTAKRMLNRFRETLFIVKTSSPHIWNRHYQMMPIEKLDLVAAAHAEQKCVEYADIVVGGSAHLIAFMDHIGYAIDAKRTYVQPNIVDFSEVHVTDERGPIAHDEVIQSNEVTFFGRLETRKGLELFCQAVGTLIAEGLDIDRVNFLGKQGGPIAGRGGLRPLDYIAQQTADWPCAVEIIDNLNQPEALSFLCSRRMIAVMPSLIENSTMAVYEALDNRIPFVATAVGGTPELIGPDYHDRTLVEPTAASLTERLRTVLGEGQVVARPAFENEDNLDTWFRFHEFVAEASRDIGMPACVDRLTGQSGGPAAEPGPRPAIASIVPVTEETDLADLAAALAAEYPDELVLCVNSVQGRAAIEAHRHVLDALDCRLSIFERIGLPLGALVNGAVAAAEAEALHLCLDPSVRPLPGYYRTLTEALAQNRDVLVTTAFQIAGEPRIAVPLGGDVATQFFAPIAFGPESVTLTRATFDDVGALEPYDLRAGLVHDLITRALHRHGRSFHVWPEVLALANAPGPGTTDPNYLYLSAKSLIDSVPLGLKKVLLRSRSALPDTKPLSTSDRHILRSANDKDTWYTESATDPVDTLTEFSRAAIVGLDAKRRGLRIICNRSGPVRLIVNGRETEPADISEWVGDDGVERATLLLQPEKEWKAGSTYPVKIISRKRGIEVERWLSITKLAEGVFLAAGRQRILTAAEFDRIATELRGRTSDTPGGLEGQIIGLREQVLLGWIQAANEPEAPVEFDLVVEGRALGTFRTGTNTAHARDMMPTRRASTGFAIDLPSEVFGISHDTDIAVIPKPEGPPLTARLIRSANGRIRSGIDNREDGLIRGWVVDLSDQARTLNVALFLDGRFQTSLRADRARSDLSGAVGLHRTDHGFAFPLPDPQAVHRAELFLCETGTPLLGSPLAIDGQRIRRS